MCVCASLPFLHSEKQVISVYVCNDSSRKGNLQRYEVGPFGTLEKDFKTWREGDGGDRCYKEMD